MKDAMPVEDAVRVRVNYDSGGLTILEVDMLEGTASEFHRMPAALSYDGRLFGKSAFNSDTNRAYYRSDVRVAYAVR